MLGKLLAFWPGIPALSYPLWTQATEGVVTFEALGLVVAFGSFTVGLIAASFKISKSFRVDREDQTEILRGIRSLLKSHSSDLLELRRQGTALHDLHMNPKNLCPLAGPNGFSALESRIIAALESRLEGLSRRIEAIEKAIK